MICAWIYISEGDSSYYYFLLLKSSGPDYVQLKISAVEQSFTQDL